MRERQPNHEEEDNPSFEAIVAASEVILPMINHKYLLEDRLRPGTGVVVGHLIAESGEAMLVPLGVIAPDGTPFLGFARYPLSEENKDVRS